MEPLFHHRIQELETAPSLTSVASNIDVIADDEGFTSTEDMDANVLHIRRDLLKEMSLLWARMIVGNT